MPTSSRLSSLTSTFRQSRRRPPAGIPRIPRVFPLTPFVRAIVRFFLAVVVLCWVIGPLWTGSLGQQVYDGLHSADWTRSRVLQFSLGVYGALLLSAAAIRLVAAVARSRRMAKGRAPIDVQARQRAVMAAVVEALGHRVDRVDMSTGGERSRSRFRTQTLVGAINECAARVMVTDVVSWTARDVSRRQAVFDQLTIALAPHLDSLITGRGGNFESDITAAQFLAHDLAALGGPAGVGCATPVGVDAVLTTARERARVLLTSPDTAGRIDALTDAFTASPGYLIYDLDHVVNTQRTRRQRRAGHATRNRWRPSGEGVAAE